MPGSARCAGVPDRPSSVPVQATRQKLPRHVLRHGLAALEWAPPGPLQDVAVTSHYVVDSIPTHESSLAEEFLPESDSQLAVVAQLVEHELPKLGVAGSNPVRRSSRRKRNH
jgi:hypothetical protein